MARQHGTTDGAHVTSISGISGISGSYGTQQATLRPPPRDDRDPVSAVSRTLGLTGDELKSRLDSGRSLSEVAERQGVPHDDLIAAIKASKPRDAPTRAGDDEDAVAERVAAQKAQPGPPPGAPRGDAAGLADESKLHQLSSLLETDIETLRGSSAGDVVQRLQDKGIDLSELRSVLNNGDLIDFSF